MLTWMQEGGAEVDVCNHHQIMRGGTKVEISVSACREMQGVGENGRAQVPFASRPAE